MVQMLHHPVMNGLDSLACCHQCGTVLGQVRVIHRTKGGVVYFCREDEDNPEESCFLKWKRRLS